MKIEIRNKEYNLEVFGTVGIAQLAANLLGINEVDLKNPNHVIAMYYAAFAITNENDSNLPSFMMFTACLTQKSLDDISTYFWREWKRLEGNLTEEEKKEGESSEEEKNA